MTNITKYLFKYRKVKTFKIFRYGYSFSALNTELCKARTIVELVFVEVYLPKNRTKIPRFCASGRQKNMKVAKCFFVSKENHLIYPDLGRNNTGLLSSLNKPICYTPDVVVARLKGIVFPDPDGAFKGNLRCISRINLGVTE